MRLPRFPLPVSTCLLFALAVSGCEQDSGLYSVDGAGEPPGEPPGPTPPPALEPAARTPGATCTANTECDAKMCTEAGRCAAPSEVALVIPDRGGDCITTACGSIGKALATGRPYVVLEFDVPEFGFGPELADSVEIAARTVTITSYDKAGTWLTTETTKPVLTVRANANVTLRNVELSPGSSERLPCVVLNEAKLTMDGVLGFFCMYAAVDAKNSVLHVQRSEFVGGGIVAQHANVLVQQSKFKQIDRMLLEVREEGPASGYVAAPELRVENTLFVKNSLGVNLATRYPATFTHVTFADTESPLLCSAPSPDAPRPTIRASIISVAANQAPDAFCDTSGSRTLGPKPADLIYGSYGLRYPSALIDALPAPCLLEGDYNGLKRPQGGGCDYGAMEAPP